MFALQYFMKKREKIRKKRSSKFFFILIYINIAKCMEETGKVDL